jgi:hypothetical protein
MCFAHEDVTLCIRKYVVYDSFMFHKCKFYKNHLVIRARKVIEEITS